MILQVAKLNIAFIDFIEKIEQSHNDNESENSFSVYSVDYPCTFSSKQSAPQTVNPLRPEDGLFWGTEWEINPIEDVPLDNQQRDWIPEVDYETGG